jgi:hypothetical protein
MSTMQSGGFLKRLGATGLKSLIFLAIAGCPTNVWITLLISRPRGVRGHVNQGFRWNARKKSKTQNLYKSTTYGCYGFGSKPWPVKDVFAHRSNRFVHKSVAADDFDLTK